MSTELAIILIHQIVFQGMFILKNIHTKKVTGSSIRGNNPEANKAIIFFALFIMTSITVTFTPVLTINIPLAAKTPLLIISILILFASLCVSLYALISLKNSWRVGVIEVQKTELIESGIYNYSRNPYFVSYLLYFFGYALLLQSLLLLILSLIGFIAVHGMIKREEKYLLSVHNDRYKQYMKRVPRYIIW